MNQSLTSQHLELKEVPGANSATRVSHQDKDLLAASACQTAYSVLIVERNDYIRDSFRSYLQHYHEASLSAADKTPMSTRESIRLLSAATIPGMISLLESSLQDNGLGVDILMVDLHLLLQSSFNLIDWLREYSPGTHVVLTTAYQVDEDIARIKDLGVTTVITKTVPFRFEELSLVLDNLRQPERAFGLQRYLGDTLEPTQLTIRSSDDIMPVFMALQAFFQTQEITNLHDLCTALIEAVTNAVYHATAGDDGNDKYIKGQEIQQLLATEIVTVTYGANANGMGVSIVDQGGRLKPQQILYWLERNMSGDNLLDTHGRGIFLIYTLCDRLIFNVIPNQKTELLMLNYKYPASNAAGSRHVNKPIYIHTTGAH